MPLPTATTYKVLLGGSLLLGLADLLALNLWAAPEYFGASDTHAAPTLSAPPPRVPTATVSVALTGGKPPVHLTPADTATSVATGAMLAPTATLSQPTAAPPPTTASAPTTATAPSTAAAPTATAAAPSAAVDNIYFERGSSRIGPDAQSSLQVAVREMRAKPNLRVTIKGHADEVGSADFNNWLSLKRAEAAAGALRAAGIDGRRIEVKGIGMAEPLDPGHDEQAFAKNRRVEFAWK